MSTAFAEDTCGKLHSRRAQRTVSVAGGVVAALVVWALNVPIAGVELFVQPDPAGPTRTVGVFDIVLTAALAGLAGWALLGTLEHFTSRARSWWTGLALVAALASLVGPVMAADGAATGALLGLHGAVAGVVIAGMYRSS